MPEQIAVLGGGAMGTACAIVLSERRGQEVALWIREKDLAERAFQSRENEAYLPGVRIPDRVRICSAAESVVDSATLVVAAIPSQFLREGLAAFSGLIPADVPAVSVVKGIENDTFARPSQIICEAIGQRPVVALCGPSHAEEMARRLPASVVAACEQIEIAERAQAAFRTDRFRVYTNQDVVGVELAGALKNVIAIAAGISDGLGYGDNAKSALVTRGMVEIARFGAAFGADPSTFAGLAGAGDLMTTCFSRHSRNRALGERLGRGERLEDVLASSRSVAEGVTTTRSVRELALKNAIEMPITGEVFAVLFEQRPPQEATDRLMNRSPKAE